MFNQKYSNFHQESPGHVENQKAPLPLDSAKHKRSIASYDQFNGDNSTKAHKPSSIAGQDIDSAAQLFKRQSTHERKNETPGFDL